MNSSSIQVGVTEARLIPAVLIVMTLSAYAQRSTGAVGKGGWMPENVEQGSWDGQDQ